MLIVAWGAQDCLPVGSQAGTRHVPPAGRCAHTSSALPAPPLPAPQCLILMHWCERPLQKETPGALKGLRGKPLEDLHSLQRQVTRSGPLVFALIMRPELPHPFCVAASVQRPSSAPLQFFPCHGPVCNAQVYSVLEATPECGREFAAAVRHILSWEDSWAAWKKNMCPEMSRPPAVMPPGAPSAADLGAAGRRGGVGSVCQLCDVAIAWGSCAPFGPCSEPLRWAGSV